MAGAGTVTREEVAEVCSRFVSGAVAYLQTPWYRRLPYYVLKGKRERLSHRRLLFRTVDYLEIVISMLRSDSGRHDGGGNAHRRVFEHVSTMLGYSRERDLARLPADCLLEMKNRIKIDALELAHEIGCDTYTYNRLLYEKNLISKRCEIQARATDSGPEISWPSEELNTAWDIFIPEGHLDTLLEAYSGARHKADQEVEQAVAAPCCAPDIPESVREYAFTSLRYVYTSRHENNRYTEARGRLRATYYALIPTLLIILLALAHYVIPFDVRVQFTTKLLVPNLYHLVAISGALGGVLALVLKFRGINRITEMRATYAMLTAQMCVGATTALIFVLVIQAGWVHFSFLSDWWVIEEAAALERQGIARRAAVEATLIAFFVGLLEGVFLQLVERMEGMLSDKERYQSPARPGR